MDNIKMVDEAFLLARINKMGKGGGSGDGPSREEFNALVERVDGVDIAAAEAGEAAEAAGIAAQNAQDSAAEALQVANENVFIAEYGVTTAEEIKAYISSEEPFAPVLVKRGNDYYTSIIATNKDENSVYLRCVGSLQGKYYIYDYTVSGDSWGANNYGIQEILVSGQNIKTINNNSLLGPGNIDIQGGENGIAFITYGESTLSDVETAISNNKFIVLVDIGQTDIYLTPVSVTGGTEAYSFVCMLGSDMATYTLDGSGWNLSIAPLVDVPEYSYDYDTQIGYFNDGVGTYPIYRKLINFGELTNAAQKTVPHGLPEGFIPLHIYGVARKNDGTQNLPLPCVTGVLENMIYLAVGPSRITVTPNSNRSDFTATITIDYYVPNV